MTQGSGEGKIPRFAVIPTKGNRRENLDKLLRRLLSEDVRPIVVDTSWDPLTLADFRELPGVVHTTPENDAVNISVWWDRGLSVAETYARLSGLALNGWDVAILNDDCLPPLGWFDAVSKAMRDNDCVAACSGAHSVTYRHYPVPISHTMTGFAFMLRGESGLSFDENMAWWYGDNEMCWYAAGHGGYIMINTHPVEHLHPNGQMTPELQEQAARDRETFISKFGNAPW